MKERSSCDYLIFETRSTGTAIIMREILHRDLSNLTLTLCLKTASRCFLAVLVATRRLNELDVAAINNNIKMCRIL